MALTVQTNMGAITALKNLNTNTIGMNKSLERLSSGFRINSAADDAAGYAISAKLTAQRGGLEAASQNAMQASAMVKMADAAINEIQNMVIRMQALATQAASASVSATDRAKLEAERAKLESQIDDIATSTNYNGVNLLDGSAGAAITAGSTVDNTTTNGISSIKASGASSNTTFTISYVDQGTGTTFNAGDSIRITDGTNSESVVITSLPTGQNTQTYTVLGFEITINSAISGKTTASGTGATGSTGTLITDTGSTSVFQVGSDNATDNQVTVSLNNSYKATDLNANFASTGLTSLSASQSYIGYAQSALDTLATNRADLGATQNQLGYVVANLATNIEQVSSAISTIKDADMATEMANFTKAQVLVQAGTAMLAQANQASQNVLALFR